MIRRRRRPGGAGAPGRAGRTPVRRGCAARATGTAAGPRPDRRDGADDGGGNSGGTTPAGDSRRFGLRAGSSGLRHHSAERSRCAVAGDLDSGGRPAGLWNDGGPIPAEPAPAGSFSGGSAGGAVSVGADPLAALDAVRGSAHGAAARDAARGPSRDRDAVGPCAGAWPGRDDGVRRTDVRAAGTA